MMYPVTKVFNVYPKDIKCEKKEKKDVTSINYGYSKMTQHSDLKFIKH